MVRVFRGPGILSPSFYGPGFSERAFYGLRFWLLSPSFRLGNTVEKEGPCKLLF